MLSAECGLCLPFDILAGYTRVSIIYSQICT